ncbi:unnamed protein product [Rotaria magnacalcarata]|uniref:Poly [ADP-ribose] polymerase n=1 Tax=Rotaria magnacalcarata TaxID=392030 RepID=A0A8S2KZN0_9BILA|nr:unnamed protein product [Rotaria magnacalcarata]
MAAGTHMAATQQAADDQASSLYFSGICQTISVKCQHRNENGLLTCSRNLYVSCPHCHLLLCIDHIHEHENLLRYEIEQLINETNIVKANIRALLTTSQQQPTSTTAQVLDEKQRTLCELLERWATVGKISMSQAALIQHQCGYISQTTQQQAAAASTAAAAAAALAVGTTNHHVAHHPLPAQQNGTVATNPNKLPSHHQPHHTSTAHANHHQTNSHNQDRSSQQLAVNAVKKRRSGKNKIVTLLMKNAEGEYECPNIQCRKSLKCQGITAHVKACAVDWLKENGQRYVGIDYYTERYSMNTSNSNQLNKGYQDNFKVTKKSSSISSLSNRTFVLELDRDVRFKAKQELINYLREHNAHVSYILTASIGSKLLLRSLFLDRIDTQMLDNNVCQLVESLWIESIGDLNNILAVKPETITLTTIVEAEAALLEIKSDSKSSSEAEKRFYSLIPHQKTFVVDLTNNRRTLIDKLDLCQMLRDMVSVNELTNWNIKASIEAKYRALKCHIETLKNDTNEYITISDMISSSTNSNEQVIIHQIYSVAKQTDALTFRSTLFNQKQLFHGSKYNNFLGILSRGLLMPKVVVNNLGVVRTDIGCLGYGLYFSDSASTSLKYTTPSVTRPDRRLLCISQVALGESAKFYSYASDLTQPPESFHSTHGVKKYDENNSKFVDDEYAIYNPDQQRLLYLVELSWIPHMIMLINHQYYY